MPEPREDDLFKESTMTFGQHLEELRTCLFKSLLGLAVGFAVGLTVGGHVVNFIQRPLNQALTSYYDKESAQRLHGESKEMEESGEQPPWTAKEIDERVFDKNQLNNEISIDSKELLVEL